MIRIPGIRLHVCGWSPGQQTRGGDTRNAPNINITLIAYSGDSYPHSRLHLVEGPVAEAVLVLDERGDGLLRKNVRPQLERHRPVTLVLPAGVATEVR